MRTIYKNGTLRFITDNAMVKYSRPEMIPYEENNKIDDVFNDWLYFYYNVDLYFNLKEGEKYPEWNHLVGIRTWEEPIITNMCEAMIQLVDMTDKGRKYDETGIFVQEKTCEDAIIDEDTFLLRKFVRDDSIWYWLNVSLYPSQEMCGIGITLSYITEEEMKDMIDGIIKFLNYAKENITKWAD